MQNLTELLTNELQELLASEHYALEATSQILNYATSPCFQTALQENQAQTRTQIMRLQCAFYILGNVPTEGDCQTLQCVVEDAMQKAQDITDPALRDAYLIGTHQKIEHLEIASYGIVRDHAFHLGLTEMADLMTETLVEKKQTELCLSLMMRPSEEDITPIRYSVGSTSA